MRTEAGAVNYLGLFAAFAVILFHIYKDTKTSAAAYCTFIIVPVDNVNSRGLAL